MHLRRFRQHARHFWGEVPPRFREGAVLLVHADAFADPEMPDVFLLGMCEPAFAELEDAVAASGDARPGDHQSLVHLWYGSFEATADTARRFDWKGEIEETILHELTHHWEQRSGLDALDRFDAAQIVNFRRHRGYAVPVGFWRDGEPEGPHAWLIDADRFVEVEGPPPWTVDPGDGQPPVTVSPDAAGFATVPARGATQDGRRGDLIVAPRPPVRPGVLARVRNWLRAGKDEA